MLARYGDLDSGNVSKVRLLFPSRSRLLRLRWANERTPVVQPSRREWVKVPEAAVGDGPTGE